MKTYYKRIDFAGKVFDLAVGIAGHGVPTSSLEAVPPMLYMNLDSAEKDIYKCVSCMTVDGAAITEWKKIDDLSEIEEQIAQLDLRAGQIESDHDRLAERTPDGFIQDPVTHELWLAAGGEVIGDPIVVAGGSGGGTGGGDNQYSISLKNLLETRTMVVSGSSEAVIKYLYTSADTDGADDGAGVGTLSVNNVKVASLSVPQGENELNIAQYLSAGDNSVKLKVENSEGSSRTLSYTITVITLTLTTTFDAMAVYSGDVTFAYTLTGTGSKVMHFLMDGVEIDTETVVSSGRSRTFTIAKQTDGAHIFSAYADMETDGVTVESNTVVLGMMWVSIAMAEPAILVMADSIETVQGENVVVPHMVYDPQSENVSVTYSVIDESGEVYSEKVLTVDRSAQKWTVQDFPAGNIVFRITCGTATVDVPVTAAESELNTDPITDALAFCFDPAGRSNLEDNPKQWTDGSVSAEFTDVAFTAADGWLTDADGASILRILPGGQVTIPYKLFESDARSSGATVEVEMATHNVRDYDTVVMSCLSGGRGFKIASQYAQLKSEQSEVSMQFKEDEKVRVSFVIEPRNLHRMIYIYVDGIMCGAVQYPSDDNFAQSPAEGITIGAESSGIDIYRIRMYTKGLTRHEILDNYIADRATLSERIELAKENNIFNEAGDIVISKLPITVPYMIISCPELPQYKDDKKTCTVEYVNPSDTSRSFIAYNAQIDVQGTSSSGYKKKNWKIKLKNGITYTLSGQTAEKYQLRAGAIPTAVFCMKADVASSEGANNVELVRLYNDTVPHKTPAQEADSRARVGIDGLPCIIFWQNTDTGEVRFWGKYNFNYDKGSEEVFGLTAGCESWEIKNNTSNRVLFKSSEFTGTAWTDDFEARYPDGYTDTAKLKAMCDWVVSTDRSAVSTDEEKAARLEKFKNEFEDHFILEPMLFYYIFTETFLMVDNRAKNFFPTTFDGVHWFPFPYDFDTAIGINNEGQLAFDYDLEDTDTVNGDNVFNGQESVLWCNLRDAYGDEIAEMYADIRGTTGTAFDYSQIVKRFADHQAVWVKAIWNEDAWEKYLEPLENDNDASYLTMLQGDKSAQREWWLYNGFRYRDSKYQCGDASKEYITLRCYEVGNITVTPYSHIHPRIKYGSYTVTERGKRNVPTTLVCPLDKMDDTEVYIYSSDRLAAIGDLSHLQVGYANFSMATKLQSLKLGDGADTYENLHLTELYVGNNELLTSLDVRNCKNLAMTVDLSECVGIEEIKAAGSAVTGFTLPVGGRLKSLEIPNTVTNLTMRDLAQFETLNMAGYDELTTFRIEHTPNVPYEQIINNAPKLDRVRLIGVEWQATSEATLQTSITKLKTCIGLDAAGDNTTAAVVTGRVYVPSISAGLLTEINEAFPQLVVVADGVPQYVVRYLNWDNTVLYRDVVGEGENAVNAVTAGYIEAPTREGTEDTGYAFKDFGSLPTNIHNNVSVVAQYVTTYRVRFMNGNTVYNTQWIVSGGNAVIPSGTPTKASTAQYTYTFSKWSGTYTNVTAPVDIVAVYTSTVRTYTVYFYNGSTLLQTVQNVPYGSTATYSGETPVDPDGNGAEFEGWSPSNTNIQGNTSCYAQFAAALEVAEIVDSWEDILAAENDGTYRSKYKVGNYKALDLGTQGIVNMQIAGFDKDDLADGTGKAPISWISKELLNTSHRMNPALVTNYIYPEVEAWTGDASNVWTSKNRYVNNDAEASWMITAVTAGTLTISYKTSNSTASINKISITVNGEAIATDYTGTTYVPYTVEVSEGDVIVVTAKYSLLSSSYSYYGNVKFESTGETNITAEVGTTTTRVFESYKEGTGTIGGWDLSEMQTYMDGTIKPLIPELVRNAIVSVKKTHPAYNTSGSSFTQETEDELWIPSYNEMFNSSRPYKALFPDSESRKKYKIGASSASWWWLRSANSNNNFNNVNSSGNNNNNIAESSGGVVLGFCT